MKRSFISFCVPLLILCVAHLSAASNGRIYIVYGSDTSVRSGLDVSRYHINAKADLYVAPNLAAYRIMDPSYRAQITDSYGRPLIMTWWMLCGGIFRYSENNNVPYPNLLPLHLIQKYHGDAMRSFGDEVSLHYHTWKWSDYNNDGLWFWNQSLTFEELRDDFDFTLAQGLLEEDMFPVSFRSGWHYMDNGWQQYLDELLPYSLHNDAPHVRSDNTEPIDNVFDWSRATLEWKPYRPSPTDYQLSGNGRGWNVRSSSMTSVSLAELTQAFVRASQGEDQVLCLWDHLADNAFFTVLERVNGMLHQLSTQYSVPFEFKTAVEAMQLWRQTHDTVKPQITLQEIRNGSQVSYRVETDEPIFQLRPFFSVKTISEQFTVAQMESTGTRSWRTVESFNADSLATVAVAVTDTAGNYSTKIIRYTPVDTFVDNSSAGYQELYGTWRSISSNTWGVDSRAATLAAGDSAAVEWVLDVPEARQYKVFVQMPYVHFPVPRLRFTIGSGGADVGGVSFLSPLPANHWAYLGTYPLSPGATVRMVGITANTTGDLTADVVKISPLIQQNDLGTTQRSINCNFVSLNDTVKTVLFLENRGVTSQTITGFSSQKFHITPLVQLPVHIPTGSVAELPVGFVFDQLGAVNDTVLIHGTSAYARLPVSATVEYFVRVVDNDDPGSYFESGTWNTSVAVAYGRTSRFSFLNQGPGQHARFVTSVPLTGYYDVQQIVPYSTNATNNARYTVASNGIVLDSIFIDQRQTTNTWISLGVFRLQAGEPVEVRLTNTGVYTAGDVLRSDAVKLLWVDGAQIRPYTVDNDSAGYSESGTWATSVAQAYGPSSRYSLIGSTTGQYASFTTRLLLPGRYDVRQIVPASTNATNRALYTVAVQGTVIDSVFIDQRAGGGSWVSLGTYSLPAKKDIEVRVTHIGGNTAGNVLRADAVQLVPLVTGIEDDVTLPAEYVLMQNFPNPFNPSTTIRFVAPRDGPVKLKIYDLLGREMTTLIDEWLPAGIHSRVFRADLFASGVYFYRLEAGSFVQSRKMLLIK